MDRDFLTVQIERERLRYARTVGTDVDLQNAVALAGIRATTEQTIGWSTSVASGQIAVLAPSVIGLELHEEGTSALCRGRR